MASKFLKGLTIQIGADTSDLSKALDSIDKKSRSLSAELGQINQLLKLDPKNVELLAQKQKVLTEAISTTEERLKTLRESEKQAQEQFAKGEISEAQYRALQREILLTEKKLEGYKKAAQDTAGATEKLSDESEGAAKGIKKAADKAKEADYALSNLGDGLSSAVTTGFSALAAAASAAVGAILATAEASREYRTEMGKLNAGFMSSSHTSATATAAYKELQSVIGETDQSVEAAQQIALLAESEEDVAKWSELAAGVVGKFGDALQPETFYEAANEVMKLGESTSAWTQMLEQTGIMAVDDFNEGLAACATESDKQAYMLGVAEKALESAAKQYKKTNEEVIRANKATEAWNEAIAEIGSEMDPVVTDIKEMGVAFLKDAREPMKKVADFVRSKLLPTLTNISSWVQRNLPRITTLTASLTATLVLFKAASVSAEMATKGLTIATIAQQAAQKALNLIMSANPYVLLATAVAGVTTALLALDLATKGTKEAVDPLTEAERALMEQAKETAEAFRDQQKATQDAMRELDVEMGTISNLANELSALADESGKVEEKDRARADYIIGRLNDALGLEIQMVDGVILKYDELKESIDDLIQSKLANALLEEGEAAYIEAQKQKADALGAVTNAEKDYETQLAATAEAEQRKNQAHQELMEASASGDTYRIQQANAAYLHLLDLWEKEDAILDEKKTAYDNASSDFLNYSNTIIDYEAAQRFAAEGNYDAVKSILLDKGASFGDYGDTVDEETARVLDTLQLEAIQAGLKAQRFKSEFMKGTDGYTKDMVLEANEGYEDALDKFSTAYADAQGVGDDLAEGMISGAENKRSRLLSKARSLVAGFLLAAREEADSHSPSRKAMAVFEDVGEGAVIGIENKTKDVARAGTKQAAAVLDAYSSQEVAGQRTLRNIAESRAAQQAASYMASSTVNNSMLSKILEAIERRQILTIDGNTLVGATAGKMDNTLGQRRTLVARGAL